jgi:hypothetical protein
MEYAKSLGRLLPNSQYCYGRKVVRLRRRTTYLLLAIALTVAYMPWFLVKAQANSLPVADYSPLYLVNETSKLKSSLEPANQSVNISDQINGLLQSWSAAHPNHSWSVAINSIDGTTFNGGVNQGQIFKTASLYKLLLVDRLFTLYKPADLAAVQLDVAGRGKTPLDKCVNLMLRVSDNPCGVAVGNLLGWSRTNQSLRQIGLSQTKINDSAGPSSTAADVNTYLVKLAQGSLLSSDAQSYVLSLMQTQRLRAGIPAGCSGCTVANKTGDLGYVRHDAAIVAYSGGRYALTIFTNGASYSQIAQLTSQIQQLVSAAAKR